MNDNMADEDFYNFLLSAYRCMHANLADDGSICDYRLWTTEELIEAYAWEAKRINQKDREMAQRSIKRELKRRFDATLRLLDDEQTTDNPKGTYRYLLNE